MRKAIFASLAALACGGLLGCDKTVQEEQQDVIDAQQDARENVAEEQGDVNAERREAQEEIRAEKKDVEDAKSEAT